MAHALTRGSSELNDAGDDESTFGDKNAIAARCAPGVDGAGESHGPFSLHGLLQAPGHEAEPGVLHRLETSGRVVAVRVLQNEALNLVDGVQFRFEQGMDWVGTVGTLGIGGEFRTLVLYPGERIVSAALSVADSALSITKVVFATTRGRLLDSGRAADLDAEAREPSVLAHNGGGALTGFTETTKVETGPEDAPRFVHEISFLFETPNVVSDALT